MKNQKRNYIKKICIIAFIGIFIAQSSFLSSSIPEIQSGRLIVPTNAANHDPILIDGNAELATFIGNEGLSGDGTEISPYIIEGFIIEANTVNGIDIRNTDAYLIIQNCKVEIGNSSEYYGLNLNNSANVNIKNNTFANVKKGIYLYKSTDNSLSGNIVFNNIMGIYLYGSNNTVVFKNNLTFNEESGILIIGGVNNSAFENRVEQNQFAGIEIFYASSNNSISNNTVINNSLGIFLRGDTFQNIISLNNVSFNINAGISLTSSGTNNTITRNNVNGNGAGIFMSYTTYATLYGNNISNNNDYGLGLWYHSCNNTIYYNSIYDNKEEQALENDGCTDNKWDNGTTGNYWGDYEIKYPDAKKNGNVWNTPYEIDGNGTGIDNFPLINPILTDNSKNISGFSIVSMIVFISVGVILLRSKIIHRSIR